MGLGGIERRKSVEDSLELCIGHNGCRGLHKMIGVEFFNQSR